MNLASRMERFLNPLELCHVFMWEKAHQIRGDLKKKKDCEWINLLSFTFKVDRSDFFTTSLATAQGFRLVQVSHMTLPHG